MGRDWDGVADEDVLRAFVSGGDPDEAFSELVARFQHRLYHVSYRYFGNHADAEDATQEAFIAVARRAESFHGGSRLSTWLYRVTVNACNDLARKRSRRPQSALGDPDQLLEAAAETPDETSARETEIEVQRALLLLDEVSRASLVLVALEGLSYEEAAEALGMPVGTVKSRVHRARARLAELLAPVIGETGEPGGLPRHRT